ncbi:MAG: hypothetical protein ACP5HG_00995 [Anaerolineae bacterium]
MFRRSSEKYAVLQEHIPLHEQEAIERAVVTVMPPVKPSQAFVNRLGRDLVEEARRQHETNQERAKQAFRLFGFLSGGLFSLVGGIVIWLLLHRESKKSLSDLSLSGPQQPMRTAGSA